MPAMRTALPRGENWGRRPATKAVMATLKIQATQAAWIAAEARPAPIVKPMAAQPRHPMPATQRVWTARV